MSNLAKDASLQRTGSHFVSDDTSSRTADGIGKEDVYLYLSAKWRGQPVVVTMSADRYAASFHDPATGESENRLTDWRTYAREAWYHDPEKNGGRGEALTDTARRALSKLCEPLVVEWLASDEYTASFQAALARMIMRYFRDDYSAVRNVERALAVLGNRLSASVFNAIGEALAARKVYEAALAHVHEVIG